MEPKFKIGQNVKFQGDTDAEKGVVLSYSFHPETGFVYQISAKEVDVVEKKVIEGIKHCREEELVDMEEKHE